MPGAVQWLDLKYSNTPILQSVLYTKQNYKSNWYIHVLYAPDAIIMYNFKHGSLIRQHAQHQLPFTVSSSDLRLLYRLGPDMMNTKLRDCDNL